MAEPRRHGFAWRLSAEGIVTEIFADGLGWSAKGRSLLEMVDAESVDKARRFLEAVRADGHASSWELIGTVDEESAVLIFSGVLANDGSLLVIGGRSTEDVELLLEELLGMKDVQASMLRDIVLELTRIRRRSDAITLDEMARLNNELASAQRALATKNAELERLNRQKREVLGMVSHDLRNPLGVVAGYAEAMLNGSAGPVSEMQRRILDRIVASSGQMQQLVDGLVDLSAIEAGSMHLEREQLDLAALLCETAELNQVLAARKNIEITCDAPAPIEVVGDASKLRQVIDNLLSNAVKYSHEGTSVHAKAETGDDWVYFSVRDEGQGIPEDELNKIFRPFGRTSVRATAGEKSTGLGLALARHIIDAHGGTIEVASQPGAGTTFSIRLPLH